jgi:broad specificity polyphosphatase/5'/3'-nucleotidase SurE
MEGGINGLPAVAFSLAGAHHDHQHTQVDYRPAATVAQSVVKRVL